MRVFSTFSATIKVIRKSGFYPSSRTASYLATQLSAVLELSPAQRHAVEVMLTKGVSAERLESARLTPAEGRSLRNFLEWYSLDTMDAFKQRAFVVSNLNTGLTLVIQASSSVVVENIEFSRNGVRKVTWVKATEEIVSADIAENARWAEKLTPPDSIRWDELTLGVDSTLTLENEKKTV
jgi:hypothetical protein